MRRKSKPKFSVWLARRTKYRKLQAELDKERRAVDSLLHDPALVHSYNDAVRDMNKAGRVLEQFVLEVTPKHTAQVYIDLRDIEKLAKLEKAVIDAAVALEETWPCGYPWKGIAYQRIGDAVLKAVRALNNYRKNHK